MDRFRYTFSFITLFVIAAIFCVVSFNLELRPQSMMRYASENYNDRLSRLSSDDRTTLESAIRDAASSVVEAHDTIDFGTARVVLNGSVVSRAVPVSGGVEIILGGEHPLLRLHEFEISPAPDLRVYLAANLGNADYIDLGTLRASKGDLNYSITEAIDFSRYKYVLLWEPTFNVVLAHAELKYASDMASVQ